VEGFNETMDNKLPTRRSFLLGLAAVPIASHGSFGAAQQELMFAGTNTGGKSSSKGIYAYRWDRTTGTLSPLGQAETASPAYMAVGHSRRYLYAANEISNYMGAKTGSVSAFSLDRATGNLTLKNVVSSGGAGPCCIEIDHTEKCVFVADGAGGSLASYRALPAGGLSDPVSNIHFTGHSVNPKRQMAPWTHCTTVSPDNRYLLVNDLGLDRITTYRFDPSTALLTPNAAPPYEAVPGAGPRSFTFHPNGRWAYSANEMGNTIDTLVWDSERGTLTRTQNISTVPAEFTGQNATATVRVDAAGRFLYASNRGANTIAVFAINATDGSLRLMQQISCGGKTPRYFALDPSNRWLLVANQDSAGIVVLARDPGTGRLTSTSSQYALDFPMFLIFA
jgi:6-phosphogluconolactonase